MNQSLETKRLIIRPFKLNDQQEIFQLSQEPGMKEWIPDQVYTSIEQVEEVLRELMSNYDLGKLPSEVPLVYSVCLKDSHQLIGHVGLSPFEGECEVGYAIGEQFQRKGLASEAVSSFCGFMAKKLNLAQINGIVALDNLPSVKVLENSGFSLLTKMERSYHGKTLTCARYVFKKS